MPDFCFRNQSLKTGEKTLVMGILNITPDSFSDGGDFLNPAAAVQAAMDMKECGAAILDLGAQSTRPGYTPITAEEEWARLAPVLQPVLELGLPVSVDTFYPLVAERALEAGCHIINDVSGTVSKQLGTVIAKYQAGWILMHAGTKSPLDDVSAEVHQWFLQALDTAVQYGVNRDNICLDPGIGFGKTHAQNLSLIANTDRVKVAGIPYLMAASRKRVINQADGTDQPPKLRDFGTTAAHTVAAFLGADFVRSHNCFAACQAARVLDALKKYRVKP